MGEAQIDIEDAIAGQTVSEYARNAGIPQWRVRKAIHDEFLIVDEGREEGRRPMRVVGGEVPLTLGEWKAAISPATSRINPSVSSWDNGGSSFSVLGPDLKVVTFRRALTRIQTDEQRREIDRLACQRVDVSEAAE